MNGTQGSGRRDQRIREHEPQHCNEPQRQFQTAVRLCPEWCVAVGEIRSNADHIRLQFLQKAKVGTEMRRGLKRRTHHKAGTHLVADLFQIKKAADPVFRRHCAGMETAVVRRVCGLVAQQIAVCAGTEKRRIAGFFPLTNGKGDGAVRKAFPYLRDNLTYTLFREICVLAALQNKRPESQRIALCTAGEDILPAQPIPLYLSVAPADAAVIAVVPAAITDFNQSTDINLVSKMKETDFLRLFVDVTQQFCVTFSQQLPELFRCQCSFLS